MRKSFILTALFCAFLLSGCAGLFSSNAGYFSPGLKQLKGRHISLVIDRINRFPHVDIGMFENRYYLFKECEYKGDNVTYNGYGAILRRDPIYWCGNIYFVTNKDGIIKDFIEDGYRDTYDYQPLFKDVIVVER